MSGAGTRLLEATADARHEVSIDPSCRDGSIAIIQILDVTAI
jgi:hypothetical protein